MRRRVEEEERRRVENERRIREEQERLERIRREEEERRRLEEERRRLEEEERIRREAEERRRLELIRTTRIEELKSKGDNTVMYALNDFIKPIIEIIPHMISRRIMDHKKYDIETEDDVIAQTVYLYHHFKKITSEGTKSCHVDLPCEGNDFGYGCLDG